MVKKKNNYLISLLMIMTLFISACSSSSSGGETASETPPQNSNEGESPKQETLNWNMTSSFPAGHNMNSPLHFMAEELKARSNGAINVTIHEGTLGEPTEAWDMTKDNTVQITYTAEGYNGSRMPVTSMIALPFEVTTPTATLEVLENWEENGQLAELTDNFKVLAYVPITPSHIFLRDKKVTSMEDLKGLKVRSVSAVQAELLTALGATGVTLPGSEVYMGLDRGVIDGTLTGIDNILDRSLYETADYALKLPLYEAVFVFLMNKETWESLSPELQAIVQEVADEAEAQELERVESIRAESWEELETSGHMEVYTLTPEEEQRWIEATSNVAEKYAEDIEKKGYPGQKALEMMREITRSN